MFTRKSRRFGAVLAVSGGALAAVSAAALTHPSAAQARPAQPAPVISGDWTVDPMHSLASFTISHLGLSLVRGRFDEEAGSIHADSAHPENSSVQFTIQTASVDTNVKMRDDDLRSKNYFDVAQYPTITFQSTSVTRLRHPSRDGAQYSVAGNLTVHGVTRQITLPFTLSGPIKDPWGASRIGVVTHTHLLRSDYNIAPGETLIGNDVDINISLEATQPLPK